MVVDNAVSIWHRLLATDEHPLNKEVAEYILKIKFSTKDIQRVEELGERCQLGQLTPKEKAEYDDYVRADLVLATWKSRARMALRSVNGAEHG